MFLQEIFTNNFEIIIPEFYITLIILVSILFGTFFIKIESTKKHNIIKTLLYFIIYLLILDTILLINVFTPIMNVSNGVLIFDEMARFIKLLLLFFSILVFLLQKQYILNNKMYIFENIILMLISILV